MSDQPKSRRVEIRLEPELIEAIHGVAALVAEPVALFVMKAILDRIDNLILDFRTASAAEERFRSTLERATAGDLKAIEELADRAEEYHQAVHAEYLQATSTERDR